MQHITIATSIIPKNFELQRVAVNSWLDLGFNVISLNSAEEAAIVRQHFQDIQFKIVNRTTKPITGKPYVYFDDVLAVLAQEKSDICGIVNSDIFLRADSGFIDFVAETVADGLLFGSRIDVDSMANPDGEKFVYGFDFFFFNKAALKIFPETEFCLGVPWWDYWAPFVPLVTGLSCRELISPVAFHVKHETKWSGELFCDYGKMFANNIAQLGQFGDAAYKVTAESSPEQLTVFSFDILQYILLNSDKVCYPRVNADNMRVEVGREQYLRMREKVIAHHRKIWEQEETIKAIRSSLSWRVTRPLRWLGGMIRTRGSGH